MLPAAKADEHLHNARDLVLRAGSVSGAETASHAKDVDGGCALRRGALRDREEVMAIPLGPTRATLREGQRD